MMNPPTIVPMNIPRLHNNRNIPFANSGASGTAVVIQYCETVYAEPSNIENNINMQNSWNGSLAKRPTKNIIAVNPIG